DDAVIVAVTGEVLFWLVVIGKAMELCPSSTVWLVGTMAAPLLLLRVICTPLAPAGAERDTVPVALAPAWTTLGLMLTLAMAPFVGLPSDPVAVMRGQPVSTASTVDPTRVARFATLSCTAADVAPAGSVTEPMLTPAWDSGTCIPPA